MIFDRLARFVVKRNKFIIVAWVVAILFAFPLISELNDVVTYQDSVEGDSYEAQKAEEVIRQQFPDSSVNSSIILVLQSDNLLTPAGRDFVLNLEESIETTSELKYMSAVVSIYDLYLEAFESLAISLAPTMHALAEQTNLSYAIEVASAESGISDYGFLQSIYDLGPLPDLALVEGFAWDVVRNGTIDAYYVALPAGMTSMFTSEDSGTTLMVVAFTKESSYRESDGSQPMEENVGVIRGLVHDTIQQSDGVSVYVTGDAPITTDLDQACSNDEKMMEPITIVLVIVLMSLFFRSVVAPLVSLGVIGMALGLSQAAAVLIGTYVAKIHFETVTLLFVVLLGVGTDYSLFMLARYREERRKGANKTDATSTAVTWAGESIATSGGTVIVAFGAMSFSGLFMLQSMGLVISIAVLVAVMAALTLVPSIAILIGDRFFWPSSLNRHNSHPTSSPGTSPRKTKNIFRSLVTASIKHSRVVIAAALVISAFAGYIYLSVDTSHDSIAGMPENESIRGLEAISESFGAGRILPTSVVIQFDRSILASDGSHDIGLLNTVENVSLAVSGITNVHEVTGPTRPYGDLLPYANLSSYPEPQKSAMSAEISSKIGVDNRTVLLEVVLSEEPFSAKSLDTVREIRSLLGGLRDSDENLQHASILVGGDTADTVDMEKVIGTGLGQTQIIVVIGAFIVLLVVLRSWILPLVAILSILLSIIWTLAATLFLFDGVLDEPVLWMVPIILFLFLMGIGMDYNVFVLTRVREETQRYHDHRDGIVEAVGRTGSTIGVCASIMAAAFGTMMLSSIASLQEFGFALALGVVFALFASTAITPAIMAILGPKWTWWGPGRFQRVKLQSAGVDGPKASYLSGHPETDPGTQGKD